jgi:phosphoglycolate phosphatase-like HAD superfamily hydrolase
MQGDPVEQLRGFEKRHDFYIGVDSDGCAFDTMEIKHKECFIPAIIRCWDLQPVSRFAREAAEFVNLYSRWRGVNRFPGLLRVFDLLAERPEALQRGFQSPQVDSLRAWVENQTRLSSATLAAEVEATDDPVLKRALAWSDEVNAAVERIVHGVPPFPGVRESLSAAAGKADVCVVSATPDEALQREWREHGIDEHVGMICGQEMGNKAEHLRHTTDGRYEAQNCLMIGDALGDMRAARDNGMLFYPILPGDEAESWRRFHEEAMEVFFRGEYAGPYEQARIEAFEARLPASPPWKNA